MHLAFVVRMFEIPYRKLDISYICMLWCVSQMERESPLALPYPQIEYKSLKHSTISCPWQDHWMLRKRWGKCLKQCMYYPRWLKLFFYLWPLKTIAKLHHHTFISEFTSKRIKFETFQIKVKTTFTTWHFQMETEWRRIHFALC